MTTISIPQTPPHSRLRILDAAAGLFRQKGFTATTLRDIAAKCGIQAGSIYYHFASKDEVLAEVLDLGITRLNEAVTAALDALPEDSPIEETLRAVISAHLSSLFEHGDYTSAHFRIWKLAPSEVQERNLVLRDAYEAIWVNLFELQRTRGTIESGVNLRVLRLFLFGALNWTLDWYQEGELTLEELASMYTDILLNGVAMRKS